MRMVTKDLLHALALSACAYSLSATCIGQENRLRSQDVSPRGVEVRMASALSTESSTRTSVQPAASVLRMANSTIQPPAAPLLPATGGQIELPAPATSASDTPLQGDQIVPETAVGSGSNPNALTPLQSRELSIPVQVVDVSMAGLGTGAVPESAAGKRVKTPFYGRNAAFKCVHWQPSNICHFPLRFEEPMLERHGHVRFGCLQPLASGAKFFATFPMLPYLYTLRPSHEPVYALGNYRPGSCAPLLRETIPYDREAAVVEALSLAGFFWAMPL